MCQEIPAVEVQGDACCHEVGGNTPCDHTAGLITCSSDRAERSEHTSAWTRKNGFLWPQEAKIVEEVLRRRERSLAFDETEKGRFRDDYFSAYIFPVVPHEPWQEKP